jgi:hypothetical protein
LGCGGPSDQCTKQASLRLSQGIPPVQRIYPDTRNFTNYHPINLTSAQTTNKPAGSKHTCHACPRGTKGGDPKYQGSLSYRAKLDLQTNKQTKEQPPDQTSPAQGLKASKLSHLKGTHHTHQGASEVKESGGKRLASPHLNPDEWHLASGTCHHWDTGLRKGTEGGSLSMPAQAKMEST